MIAILKKRNSLSRQIILYMLSFGLVCVLGSGSLLTYLAYSGVKRDVQHLLEAKTKAARLEIGAYVDDLKRKLNYLARIQGLTDMPHPVQMALLQALLRHNKAFESVLIATASGDIVSRADAPGSNPQVEIAGNPAFNQTIHAHTDFLGLLHIDPDLGVPVMALAVPIRNSQNEVAGMLWAKVNLKFLLYVLSNIHIGKTGYAYLMDHRNYLLAPTGGADFRFGPVHSTDLPKIFQPVLAPTVNSSSYAGLRGDQVIGAMDTILSVNGRWRLVVEFPVDEAYGQLHRMLWGMLFVMAGALVLGSGLAMVLSRRFVKPLRILTDTAQQLGEGDLTARAVLDDENEIGVLASSFNSMGRSLQTEIDERNRAERSLRENESRYRVLFEASPISLWEEDFSEVKKRIEELRSLGFKDLNTYLDEHPDELVRLAGLVRLVDVNAATLELLDARSRQEFQDGLNSIFTEESLAVFKHELIALDRGEKSFRAETMHRSLHGRKVRALVHLAVAPGYETSLGKVLVSLLDITEQRRAEMEKARLEEQLLQAQKMEALGQLSSGIAHDFNNLLQAISGNVQLLLIQKSSCDPEYKNLVAVEQAATKAADLIRQLLAFSRRSKASLKPVNLNQVVLDILAMLERTLPKMVKIQTRLATDLAVIQADPTQIEQVIMNLATNAVDAMEQQGTLTIETENFVVNDVYRNTYLELQSGEYVLLRVTDTGQGMDDLTRQRIFEPFFTTKAKERGTGLGLATVYGIVTGHGGKVTCYTTLGVGTTFKIFIPVGLGAEFEEVEAEAASHNIRGGSETLMLVDDESIILDIAQDALQQHGYTVLRATSGEEALAHYDHFGQEVDLVVLDLGMPGMGGERTLQKLLQRNGDARVIVASGYGGHDIARTPSAFGAASFISKPYRLDELLLLVRKVLDQQQGETDSEQQ